MSDMKIIEKSEEGIETIPQIIRNNAQKWSDRTAMCMKRFGIWEKFTWRQYYDVVKHFSLGVVSLGGLSFPNFALGPILILIFSIELGWLPVSGAGTGRIFGPRFWLYLILPAITLGSGLAGVLLGAWLSSVLPARPLRAALSVALFALGLGLCWKACF